MLFICKRRIDQHIFFSSETPLTSAQSGFSQLNFRIYGDRIQSLTSHPQTHWQIYDVQSSIADLLAKVISSSCFYMLLTTFYVFYVSFFRIYLCPPWLEFRCQDTRHLLYSKLVPRKLRLGQHVLLIFQLNAQPVTFTRKSTIHAP